MNQQDLILKAQKGDKTALANLIKQEENNIYSTLYYLKHDENELVDIMQNVLLKLTSKIGTLKNPKYFKTWLNRIILNAYYDYMRKFKRKSEILKENVSDNVADSTASPLNNLINKELDKVIKASIINLPYHYKIPITLREIQGMSYEDISTITNVSIGTVKSRIARARGLIIDEINKYQNG